MQPDFGRLSKACNLARSFDDIEDSWDSLASVIGFYGGKYQDKVASVAGPGFWNDPDMVVMGLDKSTLIHRWRCPASRALEVAYRHCLVSRTA